MTHGRERCRVDRVRALVRQYHAEVVALAVAVSWLRQVPAGNRHRLAGAR
jgi:hypothetical protein